MLQKLIIDPSLENNGRYMQISFVVIERVLVQRSEFHKSKRKKTYRYKIIAKYEKTELPRVKWNVTQQAEACVLMGIESPLAKVTN